MKKLLLLLAALLYLPAPPALAGVSCTLPFTLTNGTIADANQVMANYNALVTCLGQAAAAGINADITALTGLTTPIAPAQGGSPTFLGGTSAGSNAIVVSATTPANFTLNVNYKVRFLAGAGNTAATTLAVGATGAQPFDRQTPVGLQPMVGGEIVAGQAVEAVWDGSEYQMVSPPALGHAPGEVFDFAGTVCPAGSLEANGSPGIVQSAFPTLFAVLGTTWGAATGGNFTIPDLRGRATYSRDGTGGRINAAGGNFDGTVVGHVGGQQFVTLSSGNIPSLSTGSFSVGTGALTLNGNGVSACNNALGQCAGGGTTAYVYSTTASNLSGSTGPGAITVALNGANSLFGTLSNAAIVLKCVKG